MGQTSLVPGARSPAGVPCLSTGRLLMVRKSSAWLGCTKGCGRPNLSRVQASSEVETTTDIATRKADVQQWVHSWRARTLDSALASTPTVTAGDIAARKAEVQRWVANWRAGRTKIAATGAASNDAASNDMGTMVLGLGALFVVNKALAQACNRAGVTFPAPLIGMFAIVGTLLALASNAPDMADRAYAAFDPAINWTQRWMPLFFVPSLVTVPLAVQGMPPAVLLKVLALLAGGMVATLLFTAQAAVAIRHATGTKMLPAPPTSPPPPFQRWHYVVWGGTLAASLALTPMLGTRTSLPAGLSATVFGYLVGTKLPAVIRTVLHPIIVCAAVGNAGVAAQGALAGQGYYASLKAYLSKGAGPMGAGDVLMSFLAVVILSFGFKIYSQRSVMKRHAPEILGATALSSIFAMFTTALAARALGLGPALGRALLPRSVTVALAIPIAQQLGAHNVSIVAAGVVLTGLLGAATCQALLSMFGFHDPITRGLATAGAAHGLGTAALAAKEPDALPFGALAQAMVGIMCVIMVALPPVRAALLSIVG